METMLGDFSFGYKIHSSRACPALSNQTICLLPHIKHPYYSHIFQAISNYSIFYILELLASLLLVFKCVSSSLSLGMASHPPIPILELADHIERLKANDNLKFSQEYEVSLCVDTWTVISSLEPYS